VNAVVLGIGGVFTDGWRVLNSLRFDVAAHLAGRLGI
jgi:hypothetical protein